MADQHKPQPSPEIADYVREHAPELDAASVAAFMEEHPRPEDAQESHVAWAVRILRERGEREVGEGLPVDRVREQMHRFDR